MMGEADRGGGRRTARLGVAGLAVTTLLAVTAGAIAWRTSSFAAAGAAAQLVAAVPVWLALLLTGLQLRRAEEERLEQARLDALAGEGRGSLFAATPPGGPVTNPARFQRVSGPLFAVLTAALEGLLAWTLFAGYPSTELQGSLPGAAILCGSAFGLLLLGRYGFALERLGLPLGGAGGRRASAGAVVTLLAGLSLAGVHTLGAGRLDLVGYAFAGLEALLALELLVLLLLEAYRPRRPGEVARPPWDSRLLGLLVAPTDIARSIARAVDYQFGFGLSQTWFYRFVERWVLPLTGFALVTFWALSALVVVHPHEQALVRRLGRLRPEPLPPGPHLKLPWPLEVVEVVPAEEVRVLRTGAHGFGEDHHEEGHEDSGEEVLLWSEAHVAADEDLVLLARRAEHAETAETAPVNLLAVSATIHYRVADPLRHARRVRQPDGLLKALAERELSFMLASADLDALLTERGARGEELRARLQRTCDARELGLEILGAYLTDLHPPVETGAAFEAVTAALERRRAAVLAAEAYRERVLPAARAVADRIRGQAATAARAKVLLAEADAERFAALLALDRAAGPVFRASRYLEALVAGSRGARKVVLGRPGLDVTTDLDLEDRVRADQLDLGQELFTPPGEGDEEKED